MTTLREHLLTLATSSALPSESDFMALLDESIGILEGESGEYRPKNKKKLPGGLLDFASFQAAQNKPVIILPDLHGRRDFLPLLLDFKPLPEESATVLDLLMQHRIFLVSVGDLWHTETEGYCQERWNKAFDDYKQGIYSGQAMKEEMGDSIGVLLEVMALKKAFPAEFHFLKGNHENIMNEDGNGNCSFRKRVREGAMTTDFIRDYYSDAVLYLINLWEKLLPVACSFGDFIVTHAEPAKVLTRKEIIECDKNPEAVFSLTWTSNNDNPQGTVLESFKNICGREASKKRPVWFGGHRPVEDKYCLRQQGSYIQIHNPERMNVAVVLGDEFNPEKNIVSIK